jgi:hypothetical protein
MKLNFYAPVLIPTLNRYEHFKRCVDSLRSCIYADRTDLFIALDYPLKKSQWKGFNQINEFLKEITGFKSITIIRRKENLGATKNLLDAERRIYERFNRMILTEDDNEFSSNFLDYINCGLDRYENNDKIYAICGYCFPIKAPKSLQDEVYIYKGFSAWGVGRWKWKEEKMNYSIDTLREYLSNENNKKTIKKYSDLVYRLLQDTLKTDVIYEDIMISYQLIKNDMYSVFPKISKVRNWGNDGSGLHCGKNIIFEKQNIDDNFKETIFPDLIQENAIINNKIRNLYSKKAIHRLKRKISKLTKRITIMSIILYYFYG